MSGWTFAFAFLLLLLFSALFSGAETGVYSVSRARIEAESAHGRRAARLLSGLLRDDAGLLITLLLCSNLVQDLATLLFESEVAGWSFLPEYSHEIVIAVILTPIVFLFGELLPKDLSRRRPHLFLSVAAPVLSLARWLLSPLVWPLRWGSLLLERRFEVREEDVTRALLREEMIEILAEGRRAGALAPQAEELARNVLVLRHTLVKDIALPWDRIEVLDLGFPDEELRARALRSGFTRLPAVETGPPPGAEGEGERSVRVVGYVHQLDVIGGRPGTRVTDLVRPIQELDPDLPLDRAVARLQRSGQRLALVGRADRPLGLITLMDLLATIASDPGIRALSATAGHR